MVPRMGAPSGPAGRLTEPQSLTVASIVSRRTAFPDGLCRRRQYREIMSHCVALPWDAESGSLAPTGTRFPCQLLG